MYFSFNLILCCFLTTVLSEDINSVRQSGEIPAVVLFRFKREPKPEPQINRAMTFTGFMPNGGMTAFSAAADSYQRMQPQWYSKPSDTLTPPMEGEAEQDDNTWMKKAKKKPYYPSKYFPTKTTEEEDEEEYEPPSKRRGNSAQASFNAWFPIMLGGFPNSFGSGSRNGGNNGNGQNGNNDPYYGRSSEQLPGQTVIANSVSNGKGGVASSHAIAYGNRPDTGRSYYPTNDDGSKMMQSPHHGY